MTRAPRRRWPGRSIPDDPGELRGDVDGMLAAARRVSRGRRRRRSSCRTPATCTRARSPRPRTRRCCRARHDITRVVLLGPAHHVAARRASRCPAADAFRTPLGDVPVDAGRAHVGRHAGVVVDDRPHAGEHSLEVQLPFLQRVLDDVRARPARRRPVRAEHGRAWSIDAVWGGPETVVRRVVGPLALRRPRIGGPHDRHDGRRDRRARSRRPSVPHDACGAYPLRGLLDVARERRLVPAAARPPNVGRHRRSRDRVVGYGAFALADVSAIA